MTNSIEYSQVKAQSADDYDKLATTDCLLEHHFPDAPTTPGVFEGPEIQVLEGLYGRDPARVDFLARSLEEGDAKKAVWVTESYRLDLAYLYPECSAQKTGVSLRGNPSANLNRVRAGRPVKASTLGEQEIQETLAKLLDNNARSQTAIATIRVDPRLAENEPLQELFNQLSEGLAQFSNSVETAAAAAHGSSERTEALERALMLDQPLSETILELVQATDAAGAPDRVVNIQAIAVFLGIGLMEVERVKDSI